MIIAPAFPFVGLPPTGFVPSPAYDPAPDTSFLPPIECADDPLDDDDDLGDQDDLAINPPLADEESSFDDFDDEFDDDFEEEENDPDWDHPEESEPEPPPGKGGGRKR